ncbi:MAG: hypothetical protein ACWA6Y_06940 [Polaromonas sp.]
MVRRPRSPRQGLLAASEAAQGRAAAAKASALGSRLFPPNISALQALGVSKLASCVAVFIRENTDIYVNNNVDDVVDDFLYLCQVDSNCAIASPHTG